MAEFEINMKDLGFHGKHIPISKEARSAVGDNWQQGISGGSVNGYRIMKWWLPQAETEHNSVENFKVNAPHVGVASSDKGQQEQSAPAGGRRSASCRRKEKKRRKRMQMMQQRKQEQTAKGS
jgi:hypothetical protein